MWVVCAGGSSVGGRTVRAALLVLLANACGGEDPSTGGGLNQPGADAAKTSDSPSDRASTGDGSPASDAPDASDESTEGAAPDASPEDAGSVDAPPPDATPSCSDGARRSSSTACGLNGRGRLDEVCQAGAWRQTADCVDPDACVDGTEQRVTPCGTKLAGKVIERCESGKWAGNACDYCGYPSLGIQRLELAAVTRACRTRFAGTERALHAPAADSGATAHASRSRPIPTIAARANTNAPRAKSA